MYGARGWTRPSPRCMRTVDWRSGRQSYNQRAICRSAVMHAQP
jgi:hypothetical protein